MGRKSLYKEEYAQQAYKLCLLGATDKEVAAFFGIDESTLTRWKKRFPDLCTSLKDGKVVADMNVANSLYSKAVGYEWVEEQAIKVKAGQYEERVEVVEVRRELPPDTTAGIFWLKNRTSRRDNAWRDKHDVDHSGEVTIGKIERVIVDEQGIQTVDTTADVVNEIDIPGDKPTIQ
jgi:hypothetical protein